jgi:hypothetical protein
MKPTRAERLREAVLAIFDVWGDLPQAHLLSLSRQEVKGVSHTELDLMLRELEREGLITGSDRKHPMGDGFIAGWRKAGWAPKPSLSDLRPRIGP